MLWSWVGSPWARRGPRASQRLLRYRKPGWLTLARLVLAGDDAAEAYKDAVDRFLGKKVDLRFVDPKPTGLVRSELPVRFSASLGCSRVSVKKPFEPTGARLRPGLRR